MSHDTKNIIISQVLGLMATTDPRAISMRKVADLVGVQQSVIYHHFHSKEELIAQAFQTAYQQLQQAYVELPAESDVHALLSQRIKYQLDNGHAIIPMLRYFMAFKQDKQGQPGGYIPQRAYAHIKEVIDLGVKQGVYASADSDADARVIVHAINGFVMEYYPDTGSHRDELIRMIQNFIERSLTKGGRM